MDENVLIISTILLLGCIVYTFIFRASLKLKMNTNVYLLSVTYFIAPMSLLLTLLVLTFTLYQTHTVKTKLNTFIFWWILINTVFTIVPYAVDNLSNDLRNFSTDPAGSVMASGLDFIIQVVFQSITLVTTIIIFFVHKNYVQKRKAGIHEN
ncbi:hypothetical protein [Aquimarina muelleri]|uniref:Uncharacterized protein n=1 Tax=Aquimarina muelleri TaxID=279356 RepID=A0A918N4W7_9FLAO|nr:hypothetical protein [Aquimarina muelleri]MCX2761516.1 hypothetical protein [Aquimarina muelleri]GGX32315.1 hypothetical protein GCM10007384_36460 [Aquimarina muelleri]